MRQPFAGACGCVVQAERLVWARPSIKVSENPGAGYGRKSRSGTGQHRVRVLRDESELSAKLGNQHFLDVGKPRRAAQV